MASVDHPPKRTGRRHVSKAVQPIHRKGQVGQMCKRMSTPSAQKDK